MVSSKNESIWSWTRAGLGVAVLAVLLAAVGLVGAIRQTQAVPLKRIAELRPEAVGLVARINAEITRQVRITLQDARSRCPTTAPADAVPPEYPGWIPLVFTYNGGALREVFRRPGSAPVLTFDYDSAGFTERLRSRLDALGHTSEVTGGDILFLAEPVSGRTILFAAVWLPAPDGPVVQVALLDTFGVQRAVVLPLLAPHTNLELTSTSAEAGAWMEPLAPALPSVAIRPSTAFVSARRESALRRTLVYVGIMLLVLAALLIVVRGMMRVARREMELSRLKSAFVADVSHELKTPLALIQMFGETLLEGRVRSEEKKQEYYEIIIRESKRLSHLINNILDFSRIETGKRIYQMRRVRPETIVREVYEVYRHELEHEGFEHELIVADGLPEVDADPDAISQVLLNLISNAIKYSDEERSLRVELGHDIRRGRCGVLISVRDCGMGIRPEDRGHLFDGFFRAPDDKVRKRRGAGLGLALVRDIVHAHQGFVEVESRLVKGTAFHIFLPQSPPQQKEESDG